MSDPWSLDAQNAQEASPLPDLADALALWSTSLDATSLPPAVIQAARRVVLDTTGAALAGSTTPLSHVTRRLALEREAAGPCHVIADAARLNPVGAAFVNTVAATVLDFDPLLARARLPVSGVIFPTVMAATEASAGTAGDLIAGLVAGLEGAALIAAHAGAALSRRGWSAAAPCALAGATLGAARTLRLDAEAAAHALRLAVSKAGSLRLADTTSARAVSLGGLAESALRACLLAKEGVAGPPGALDGPGGLFDTLAGLSPKGAAAPCDTLGRAWSVVEPGLTFKLHPLAAALLPAVEEAARLLSAHQVARGRVRRVTVSLAPGVVVGLERRAPISLAQAQHSPAFAIGCLLTFGQIHVGHLRPAVLEGPALQDAMARVRVRPAPDGLGDDPTIFEHHPHAAGLVIEIEGQDAPLTGIGRSAVGAPDSPLSDDRLEDKFIVNARLGGIEPARARVLARRIWDLPG